MELGIFLIGIGIVVFGLDLCLFKNGISPLAATGFLIFIVGVIILITSYIDGHDHINSTVFIASNFAKIGVEE